MSRRKRRAIARKTQAKQPNRNKLREKPVLPTFEDLISASPGWDLPRDENMVEVDGYWDDTDAIVEAANLVGAKVTVNGETGDVTTELPVEMQSQEGVKRFAELVVQTSQRRAGMVHKTGAAPGIYIDASYGESVAEQISAEFDLPFERVDGGDFRFEIPAVLSTREANRFAVQLLQRLKELKPMGSRFTLSFE